MCGSSSSTDRWIWVFVWVWVITIGRQRLKVKVKSQGQRCSAYGHSKAVTRSVWPQSSTDDSLFSLTRRSLTERWACHRTSVCCQRYWRVQAGDGGVIVVARTASEDAVFLDHSRLATAMRGTACRALPVMRALRAAMHSSHAQTLGVNASLRTTTTQFQTRRWHVDAPASTWTPSPPWWPPESNQVISRATDYSL